MPGHVAGNYVFPGRGLCLRRPLQMAVCRSQLRISAIDEVDNEFRIHNWNYADCLTYCTDRWNHCSSSGVPFFRNMKTTDRPFTSGLNLAMQDGLLSGGGRFFTCSFLCPHKKRLTTGAGCPMVSPPMAEKQPSRSGRVSGSAAKREP